VVLAVIGAVAYGVTVVIGRELAAEGVPAGTALATRFGIAASLLILMLTALRIPLLPPKGARLRIFLLGALGYATESTLFFLALARGSASACALIFYVYPGLIVTIEYARGSERLTSKTVGAVLISLCGTTAVVLSTTDIAITPAGIALALAAALVYALYLIVGRHVGREIHAMTTAAWIALGACVACFSRGLVLGEISNPVPHLGLLCGYGFCTGLAFWLTYAALTRIGASRTAIVMTFEAFAAVLIAAAVLGEAITPVQGIGGAAILVAAAVAAGDRHVRPESQNNRRRV
jgi:drug/metabolite transporter (DMT)-like permease